MIKYITPDYNDGSPSVQKITSSFEKVAYVMDDEIKQFIEKNIKPKKNDKKHMYLWINCFPEDALIECEDNHKQIKDINVGDKVKTHNNRFCSVKTTMQREYTGDLYKIKPVGLPSFDVTDEHPFYIIKKEDIYSGYSAPGKVNDRERLIDHFLLNHFKWEETKNLRKHDYLVFPIQRSKNLYNIGEKAYLYGQYIGDGNILKAKYHKKRTNTDITYEMGIVIATDKRDKDIIEKIENISKKIGGSYSKFISKKVNICVSKIFNKNLVNECKKFFNEYSFGKKLNNNIFDWDEESKKHLIGGYIDSDGCVNKKGEIQITSINKNLIFSFRKLLLSLNIKCSISKKVGGGFKNSKKSYELLITASLAKEFKNYSVKVSKYQYKDYIKNTGSNFILDDYFFIRIADITKQQVQGLKVYNFSVDKDESYTVNGVISHNCMGSGEIYGDNSRGDYFPREELIKHHKTFETNPASAFQNHANKDPNIRLGEVIFSYFNKDTDRVEVLERIDWERVAKYGQEWLKNLLYFMRDGRVDQPINVSMGTKIEGDFCSVCGKFARNNAERCEHLPAKSGQWVNGKKCYMINKRPNFFDMSFVRRGADRTARVFQKVASMEEYEGNPGVILYDHEYDKLEQMRKTEPIEKKKLKKTAIAPTFSKDFLNAISEYELPEILGTLKVAGCYLKPEEYQYISLKKINQEKLAEDLWEKNSCFEPIQFKDSKGIEEKINEDLLNKIAYIIPERSEYKGFAIMRSVEGIKIAEDTEFEIWNSDITPIIQKGYYNYISSDIEKTAGIGTFLTMLLMMLPEMRNIGKQVSKVRQTEMSNIQAIKRESPSYKIPQLGNTNVVNPIPVMVTDAPLMRVGYSGIFNPIVKNPFIENSMKIAGFKGGLVRNVVVPGAIAAGITTYGVGREQQKQEAGDPSAGTGITGFIAKHPTLTALGTGTLAAIGSHKLYERFNKKASFLNKISSEEIMEISEDNLNMYKDFLRDLNGENLIGILENIPENVANAIVKS